MFRCTYVFSQFRLHISSHQYYRYSFPFVLQQYIEQRQTVHSAIARSNLRKSWDSLATVTCTVGKEMEGLRVAQRQLLQLARNKLRSRLPEKFEVSVIGPSMWPKCPPLAADIEITNSLDIASVSKSSSRS